MFYFRARKREPKRTVESRISTQEDKLRRHKNKERIWRRAVKRLSLAPVPALAGVHADVTPPVRI